MQLNCGIAIVYMYMHAAYSGCSSIHPHNVVQGKYRVLWFPSYTSKYTYMYVHMHTHTHTHTHRAGDVIALINTASGDWWKGSVGDKKGYFPATYVQLVSRGNIIMRAIYDYSPLDSGEIPLEEGQVGGAISVRYTK